MRLGLSKITSSSRPVKSEKKERNSSSGNMELLSTKHGILMENHETLLEDYKSRQDRLNHLNGYIDCMKFVFENQTKELEETNQNLLKEFEKERNEKEKREKNIEEMEKTENELKVKNQELMIEKEKEEEELKKSENRYNELTEKISEVQKESSEFKSLIEEVKNLMDQEENKTVTEKFVVAENLIGQEGKDDVTVHVETKTTIPKSEQVVDELLSKGDMMDMADTKLEIKKAEPKKSLNRSPTPAPCEPYANKSHYDGDNKKDEVIVVEEHNANKTVKEKSGVCSQLKPRYDDDDENDEVIVVDEKKSVKDTIVISDDDCDVEYHNPPRENSNITFPRSSVVGVKQEPQYDGGPNSSKAKLVSSSPSSSSSSSSSSSDEFVFLQFPVKKPRVDSNKSS